MRTRSFLRMEEHRAISSLFIDGKILDVGGSKKSGYHELIKGDHEIVVGNIDASYGIDVIFDAEKKWPFEDARFSGVLFVNVLEHLFEYKNAVSEAYRVLNKNGIVAGVVPFMFNVHGSPNDYFRYTGSALERILSDAGFGSVKIKELGSGAFGVIYHALIGFVRWNWLAQLLIPIFRAADRTIARIKPQNKMSAKFMPLGYYFEAKK